MNTITKKGVEHYALVNPKLEIEVKRAQFHFGNLFSGDNRLGRCKLVNKTNILIHL